MHSRVFSCSKNFLLNSELGTTYFIKIELKTACVYYVLYSSQISVQKKKKVLEQKIPFYWRKLRFICHWRLLKLGSMPCFALILQIPVKDWLVFSQQLNSPAFLQSRRMIPVRLVINCLHFSEHEVCWFCNTKHFLSFLCHVFLAMISHTEHVVYLLYDKSVILKENHTGYVGGRICGQGPPFCGFTFNFFWSLLTKTKNFADKATSLKNWSIFLWMEDGAKPPAEKTAALCRKKLYVTKWMDVVYFSTCEAWHAITLLSLALCPLFLSFSSTSLFAIFSNSLEFLEKVPLLSWLPGSCLWSMWEGELQLKRAVQQVLKQVSKRGGWIVL